MAERNITDNFPELIKNITSHIEKNTYHKINAQMQA